MTSRVYFYQSLGNCAAVYSQHDQLLCEVAVKAGGRHENTNETLTIKIKPNASGAPLSRLMRTHETEFIFPN